MVTAIHLKANVTLMSGKIKAVIRLTKAVSLHYKVNPAIIVGNLGHVLMST
jgi:hypothetical protein